MSFALNNLTPTAAVDVVGVFDDSFNQLFVESNAIKASVKEEATFFKHPLEDSTTRVDHIVYEPIEIALSVLITGADYRNVYQQISQAFRSQSPIIIQTRTGTYENMYLQGIPHDETPDSYDSVIINLALTETLLAATTVTFQPARTKDTSTVSRGQQEPSTPTAAQETKGSTLSRVFK